MRNKGMLIGLIALLTCTGSVRAQGGLGVPVPTDGSSETEVQGKTYHPILGFLTGNRVPARTTALMPPTPPAPTREEINRMVGDGGFSPAEIAAAKIRFDENQAKARRAAVRYLATVDCNYYPEAEYSLIAALRCDRNELVRLEAAQALGSCRGVTVRILDALHLTATAQESDGNPAENSPRVRQAAKASLDQLLAVAPKNMVEPTPPMPTPAPSHPREVPATLSTAPRTAAPAPAPTKPTLLSFWLNFIHGRDANQQAIDPRLRGITPIGGDNLAIPEN